MVTEIADATTQLFKLIDDAMHRTQTTRLDAAIRQAQDDVESFKDSLLARRVDDINLRLAGLQHGILVHVTDAEGEQLRALQPQVDGLALLGLYARGRAADLAAECGQVLQVTASTAAGGGTNAGNGTGVAPILD